MEILNFRDFINFAERYLRFSEERGVDEDRNWLFIPSILLSWTAIESFVNNRLEDYASLPEDTYELHERAFLLEKRLKFEESGNNAGSFALEGTDYHRLEDKILFLIAKFSKLDDKSIRVEHVWQRFQELKHIRDGLMHPRIGQDINLDINIVRESIETAKDVIRLLTEHLWSRPIDF